MEINRNTKAAFSSGLWIPSCTFITTTPIPDSPSSRAHGIPAPPSPVALKGRPTSEHRGIFPLQLMLLACKTLATWQSQATCGSLTKEWGKSPSPWWCSHFEEFRESLFCFINSLFNFHLQPLLFIKFREQVLRINTIPSTKSGSVSGVCALTRVCPRGHHAFGPGSKMCPDVLRHQQVTSPLLLKCGSLSPNKSSQPRREQVGVRGEQTLKQF